MKVLEGVVAAPNAKVAVVIARFNSFINESLLEGAVDTLKRIGQVKDENITLVRAPGAYELPLVARRLTESKSLMRLWHWERLSVVVQHILSM
ncbi:6,7-dimethyl-8-ribityllumazine synthase [Rodentibacter pneumotropicus]|uniref:6,7-dimethyl-8-ribityllumazine synthase n=1 Tax=Rodentibacter pneumotropicus TaxID=758 RepID=A0A3S4U745_9PAST|nr:6,7-dimethyl-8-ribityllumazine synthase [Rodentibacter pneumotropicus]